MSNTYELIQHLRDELPEDKIVITEELTHTGLFVYASLVRMMNTAQHMIQMELMAIDDSLFMTYATTNTVANQDSYEIPSTCLGKRVRNIELHAANGGIIQYLPCDVSQKNYFNSIDPLITWLLSSGNYYRYYILDDDIFPTPKITESGTSNLYVYYTKRLPNLDFNVVAANASATDLTLSTTAPPTADYFNNYQVSILGTGGGQDQTKVITDYSAARVCTVSTWTTNPTTSDYYAIECELGEEYEPLLIKKVLYQCYLKMGGNHLNTASAHLTEYNMLLDRTINVLKDKRQGGPHYGHYTGDY